MAYLKPNAFTAKVFNRVAMATGIGGSQTLIVTGRRTGKEQRLPVVPVDVDGSVHLVSPRGETEWVRNVRKTPRVAIENKSGRATYTATEVPVSERGPVIEAYRSKAGKTVASYWKQLPDDRDHPVFRLS